MIDQRIDKLTESIEDVRTGRSYQTDIRQANLTDLKNLASGGWRFDWVAELSESEVYKLTVPKLGSTVHGLISLTRAAGFVQANLVECHPENIGRKKKYRGVAGNLFAFAANMAFDLGHDGFVMFIAKSELISHYEATLGAKRMGRGSKMFLDTAASSRLVAQYFGDKHGNRS
ncbi:MAG: hypothetical protein IAG10_21480 [Planctomycetaceae bacterium]|nr:hypothetical protein [Planctomycetaceae bacterium]